MEWGVEQFALAAVGALFLCSLAVALSARVRASADLKVGLGASAAAYVAASLTLPSIAEAHLGAYAWFVPLVPMVTLAVSGPSALQRRWSRRTRQAAVSHSTLGPAASVHSERLMARRALDPHTTAADLADLAYGHPALWDSIAANPSTPASVLGWLATSGDERVRATIAARDTRASTDIRRAG